DISDDRLARRRGRSRAGDVYPRLRADRFVSRHGEIFHLALPYRRQCLPELAAKRGAAFPFARKLRRGNFCAPCERRKFPGEKWSVRASSVRLAETACQTTRRHRADDLRRTQPRRSRANFGLLGNHRLMARVRRAAKTKTLAHRRRRRAMNDFNLDAKLKSVPLPERSKI